MSEQSRSRPSTEQVPELEIVRYTLVGWTGPPCCGVTHLKTKLKARPRIEASARNHYGLVRPRTVCVGQILSLFGRGSDVRKLRHRNLYWARGRRAGAFDRCQHLLGGHVNCVSVLTAWDDFVGKDALKLELLPQGDSGFLRPVLPAASSPFRALRRSHWP